MGIKAAADYLAVKDYLDTNPFVKVSPSMDSESLIVGRTRRDLLAFLTKLGIDDTRENIAERVLALLATALDAAYLDQGLMNYSGVADPYAGFAGAYFWLADPFEYSYGDSYPEAADPSQIDTSGRAALPFDCLSEYRDPYTDLDRRLIASGQFGYEGDTFMGKAKALGLGGKSIETNLATFERFYILDLLSPTTLNAMPIMKPKSYNNKPGIPTETLNNLPLSPTDPLNKPTSLEQVMERTVPGDGRTVGELLDEYFSDQLSEGDE